MVVVLEYSEEVRDVNFVSLQSDEVGMAEIHTFEGEVILRPIQDIKYISY